MTENARTPSTPRPTTPAALLREVEKFIVRHKLSHWQFGAASCGDNKLVSEMRQGRELRSRTANCVWLYMQNADKQARQAEADRRAALGIVGPPRPSQ